jgi:hypothetical protein
VSSELVYGFKVVEIGANFFQIVQNKKLMFISICIGSVQHFSVATAIPLNDLQSVNFICVHPEYSSSFLPFMPPSPN